MDRITRHSLSAKEGNNNEQDDEFTMPDLSFYNPLLATYWIPSIKRKDLETLGKIWKDEDKVIVVSQWASLLGLVGMILKEHNVECLILLCQCWSQSVLKLLINPTKKNRNPRVSLSLTAEGMGLNLVCNHILLFNLCWNHQLECQSHKRIYRVGQEKQERIYIFTIIFWDFCREMKLFSNIMILLNTLSYKYGYNILLTELLLLLYQFYSCIFKFPGFAWD